MAVVGGGLPVKRRLEDTEANHVVSDHYSSISYPLIKVHVLWLYLDHNMPEAFKRWRRDFAQQTSFRAECHTTVPI